MAPMMNNIASCPHVLYFHITFQTSRVFMPASKVGEAGHKVRDIFFPGNRPSCCLRDKMEVLFDTTMSEPVYIGCSHVIHCRVHGSTDVEDISLEF